MNARTQFTPFPTWTWRIPEFFNIGVACCDAHLDTPVENHLAMIVEDDNLGESRATYAELAARTSQFAQLLRKHAIQPGDRVLIRLANSLDYPTAFLGAMKAGAIAVPTSTLLTAEEVIYLVKDSAAAVLTLDHATWASIAARIKDLPEVKLVLLSGKGEVIKSSAVTVVELGTALRWHLRMVGTARHARQRPRLSGLHLRHHRLSQGRAARAPRADRARAGIALLV